jgi:hypothetical protein
MQLFHAVMNLSLSDMEALAALLPRQIAYRKLECSHVEKETTIAENVSNVFALATGKPSKRGRVASPIGAQSLLKELLSENERCSRQEALAYCISKNDTLTPLSVDNASQVLVKRGFLVKYNGTWKRAA